MRVDLQSVIVCAIIVEETDTSQMSARHLSRSEMSLLEERVEEMNHLEGREGVKKIDMNEDLRKETKIRREETTLPRDTQEEDPKLMLVNGYPVLTPITNPKEAITPTPTIVKMKVLPE
jgi:hypothetical protein